MTVCGKPRITAPGSAADTAASQAPATLNRWLKVKDAFGANQAPT